MKWLVTISLSFLCTCAFADVFKVIDVTGKTGKNIKKVDQPGNGTKVKFGEVECVLSKQSAHSDISLTLVNITCSADRGKNSFQSAGNCSPESIKGEQVAFMHIDTLSKSYEVALQCH